MLNRLKYLVLALLFALFSWVSTLRAADYTPPTEDQMLAMAVSYAEMQQELANTQAALEKAVEHIKRLEKSKSCLSTDYLGAFL